MASATIQELELVSKLRKRISGLKLNDEQQSNQYLLRWVRARDHDLSKAEEMLKNSLNWRKENDIDNLYKWEIPSHMLKEFPFVISGLDHDGCPVGILPLGTWDVKKAVESGLADMYVKYVDHIMVHQFGQALKNLCSSDVTQIILILDMKGYSFRQITSMTALETIMETVKRFDLNHPETLKMAIIINAPTYFSIAFEIVKRVMSAKTITKVQVYGTNSIKWKSFLLKYIPPESLPTNLGGVNSVAQKVLDHKNDEDSTIINNNNGTKNSQINENPASILTIKAGSKVQIHTEIQNYESVLDWSFKTHKYDIGFSIIHENQQEVYSYQKFHATNEFSKGAIQCKNLGKYTLIFDNTHSRFREKTVEYTLEVQQTSITEKTQRQKI